MYDLLPLKRFGVAFLVWKKKPLCAFFAAQTESLSLVGKDIAGRGEGEGALKGGRLRRLRRVRTKASKASKGGTKGASKASRGSERLRKLRRVKDEAGGLRRLRNKGSFEREWFEGFEGDEGKFEGFEGERLQGGLRRKSFRWV